MVKINKKNNVTEEVEGNVIEGDEQLEESNKLQELEKKIQEYKNLYLHALADYKNLENRIRNERERMRFQTKKEVVEQMVEVLDVMEQAEAFNNDQGLLMVIDTFRRKLAELGVKEIDLIGNEYDPKYAEVVEVVGGKQNDIIVEVLAKAYEMHGEVIRHAKVKVSKVQ